MAQKSSETCPVCESDIPDEKEKCPECGALLDMFEFDLDIEEDIPEESIEKVKELIVEEGEDEELIEAIKELGSGGEGVEDVEEVVTFACPICDSEVGEDDSECPNCGAIFEVEEEEKKDEEKEESISIDIKEEVNSFQNKIDRFEREGLDMKYPKNYLSEFKHAGQEGDKESCEELSQKLDESLNYTEEIMNSLKKIDYYLDPISEKNEDPKFEDEVKKVYKGCELGEFRTASKKAKQLEAEIKNHLQKKIDEVWLEEFIESTIEEADSSISDIGKEMPIDYFREKINEARSLKNQGDLAEGLCLCKKTLDSIDTINKLYGKIREAEKLIDEIEKREDGSEFRKGLDQVMEKIESGEEQEALEMIGELIPELENTLEDIEKEKAKKEEEAKEKELEEKISEMKSLLEIEIADLELSEEKEIRDEIIGLKEEEKHEEAIAKFDQFKESFEKKIKEQVERLKKRFEENGFEEEFPRDELEKLVEKEDHFEALNLLKDTEERLESLKKREENLSEKISKIEGIIEDAVEIGFETDSVEEKLEKAKDEFEKKRFDSVKENIDACEDELQEKLVNFLRGEIENAKKTLRGVKSDEVDVKKTITYLKKANQAKKENELERGFEALKNYKKEMEVISEI